MREKLSVIIPCKNERRNIRPCVESAAAVANEVIVADSGSTDGTLEIARSLPQCRVIEHEWIGYARFKNWAIPQAAHPWVITLDADERITPELSREIDGVLHAPPASVDAYWIRRIPYFLGYPIRHGAWANDWIVRLFRRDRCRYHEVPVHEGIDVADERTRRLQSVMLHYTCWSYEDHMKKMAQYARLAAADRYRRGKRASVAKLLLSAPLRFLHAYVLRGGFRDGAAGLQVATLAAMSSYLKQACLWELHHGVPQPDPEAAAASQRPAAATARNSAA